MLSLVTSRLTLSGGGGCVHKTEKMDGSFFIMVYLLVVMATLILESGNVERNPGPVGKSNSLHFSDLINIYGKDLGTAQHFHHQNFRYNNNI